MASSSKKFVFWARTDVCAVEEMTAKEWREWLTGQQKSLDIATTNALEVASAQVTIGHLELKS